MRYLNDFAQRFKLNIKYNTTVKSIRKYMRDGEKRFELFDQREEKTSCKIIIVATGISKPNDVEFTGLHFLSIL